MADEVYAVRFRCPCGASYAVGMLAADEEDRETAEVPFVGVPGNVLRLRAATSTDDEALRDCGICGRNVLAEHVEAELEDAFEVRAGVVDDERLLDLAVRPSRFFWDPDFSGDAVLPAEHWETLRDLAALATGRSSATK